MPSLHGSTSFDFQTGRSWKICQKCVFRYPRLPQEDEAGKLNDQIKEAKKAKQKIGKRNRRNRRNRIEGKEFCYKREGIKQRRNAGEGLEAEYNLLW